MVLLFNNQDYSITKNTRDHCDAFFEDVRYPGEMRGFPLQPGPYKDRMITRAGDYWKS